MVEFLEFLRSALRYKGAVGVTGLIVLCALLVVLQILRLPVFVPIGESGTVGLLSLIVRSVFWLATTAVAVSGLSYVVPARVLDRLLTPLAKVEYAVAIFQMFEPTRVDPIAEINDRFETYVGFPYYSRESDHPSYWPARVFRDREALSERFVAFFDRDEVRTAFEAARARAGDTSSVEVRSSAPEGADPISAVIATARMFFNFNLEGDANALTAAIGAPLAREFLAVEAERKKQRAYLPNRIAILRVHNASKRTVRDLTIEYEVAGAIYDTKVRAVSEGANAPSLPFEHRLVIPALLAGQSYDITIWYSYLTVNERVFPDKINYIQELTQGFTISNIAAGTGTQAVFTAGLLKDVPAYERLYDGDARRSDNPERELAALFAARAKASAGSGKAHDEEHLTADDMDLDGLAAFAVAEAQIDNVWVGFKSSAGKRYRAVCVYAHPSGPYALLSSEDRDRPDFIATRTDLAEALGGQFEVNISDRSDDICSTIAVAAGFTRAAIIRAFRGIEAAGCQDVRVEKLHYHKRA